MVVASRPDRDAMVRKTIEAMQSDDEGVELSNQGADHSVYDEEAALMHSYGFAIDDDDDGDDDEDGDLMKTSEFEDFDFDDDEVDLKPIAA